MYNVNNIKTNILSTMDNKRKAPDDSNELFHNKTHKRTKSNELLANELNNKKLRYSGILVLTELDCDSEHIMRLLENACGNVYDNKIIIKF